MCWVGSHGFTSVKPSFWRMFACAARDPSPEFEVLFLDVIIFVVLSTNAASQNGGNDSMGSFRLARAPGLEPVGLWSPMVFRCFRWTTLVACAVFLGLQGIATHALPTAAALAQDGQFDGILAQRCYRLGICFESLRVTLIFGSALAFCLLYGSVVL